MALVIPVILCGGSGTRLWPLSRSGFPKQFLALSGDGSSLSLFQQAVQRIHSVASASITLGDTLVVTNEEHRFLVLDQLRELRPVNATLLLEPCGRNTAPALAMAALCATHLYQGQDPMQNHINVGFSSDISISELAKIISEIVGFKGGIVYDKNKPDGMPRKSIRSDKLNQLGWAPKISLNDGLRLAYQSFRSSV